MHSFDDVPQPKRYTFDPTEEPIDEDENIEHILQLDEINTRIANLKLQYATGFCMTSWDYEHEIKMLNQARMYFEHRIDTYNRQLHINTGKAAVERLIRDIRNI
jgi:hypothetical protein